MIPNEIQQKQLSNTKPWRLVVKPSCLMRRYPVSSPVEKRRVGNIVWLRKEIAMEMETIHESEEIIIKLARTDGNYLYTKVYIYDEYGIITKTITIFKDGQVITF